MLELNKDGLPINKKFFISPKNSMKILIMTVGNNGYYVQGEKFSALSTAATKVLGRQANGWVEWRDEEGKTADELVR